MKKKNYLIFVLLIVLLVILYWFGRHETGSDGAMPEPSAASWPEAPLAGAADILLDLRNDLTREQIDALAKRHDLDLHPNSRFSFGERLYRATLRGRALSTLLARLRADEAIELAEPDQMVGIPPQEKPPLRPVADPTPRPEGFPNDPKFPYQWHLHQINMQDAWPRATGKGVVVAVIDTGVAYRDYEDPRRRLRVRQVPDLQRTEFVPGYDFVNDNDIPVDDHGHGTHVAGTIAQSTHNGVGVAGMAFGARIMPLKVLSRDGYGNVADIAEAIRYAADHGAQVINMSLGGSRSSAILRKAVEYAYKQDVLVVCAAGNDGRGRVGYPAAYPGAVAVAATQFDKTATFYSNWGPEIDLAAPGGNTRVDQNNDGVPDGVMQNTIVPGHPDENDYLVFMGTSMASPHVAGAAALIMEQGITKPDAVERLLKNTAIHPDGKEWDPHFGAGILDVGAALSRPHAAWGASRLGLGLGLGVLLLGLLRRRNLLGVRPGPGLLAGLVAGASGLFFLPLLPLGTWIPEPVMAALSHGIPSWDLAFLGPASHQNPLFHSALLPFLLGIGLYSLPRLRPLLVGLCIGVAAHLTFSVFFVAADLRWIPNLPGLDSMWLALNAGACLALGVLLARR